MNIIRKGWAVKLHEKPDKTSRAEKCSIWNEKLLGGLTAIN
jgi:hypothetical protein